MEITSLKELERNAKLKKNFFGRNLWQNYAFVPPMGVLFISLFGILYLYNHSILISLYTIPFACLFLFGTIWLKATKKHLIEKKISEAEFFLVCEAIPLTLMDNKTVLMFCTDQNRHNKHYLEKLKKEITEIPNENDNALNIFALTNKPKTFYKDNLYIIALPKSPYLAKKTSKLSPNDYKVVFSDLSHFNILSIKKIKGILLKK